MIGNETLERMEGYIHVYLGQAVSANPAHDSEIMRRIREGWSVFGKHGDMNSNLPLLLDGKVYNQYILPVLTYSSEPCSPNLLIIRNY